jgi:hypothetical protein
MAIITIAGAMTINTFLKSLAKKFLMEMKRDALPCDAAIRMSSLSTCGDGDGGGGGGGGGGDGDGDGDGGSGGDGDGDGEQF